MFKFIKNNLAPFLTGIFFTLFIVMVIVVIYLFSENRDLRREVNNVKREITKTEIQPTSPVEDKDTTIPAPVPADNTGHKTYLIPNQIPTRPSLSTEQQAANVSTQSDVKSYEPGTSQTADKDTDYQTGTKTFNIPKEVDIKPVTGDAGTEYQYTTGVTTQSRDDVSTGKRTFEIPKEVDIKPVTGDAGTEYQYTTGTASQTEGETSAGTKTYYIPNQVQAQPVDNLSQADVKTEVNDSQEYVSRPVFDKALWEKLKNGMTKRDVKKTLGNPDKSLSRINSSTYEYVYLQGKGQVHFNREGRVSGWEIP